MTKRALTKPETTAASNYVPKPKEKAALEVYLAKRKERTARPRIKVASVEKTTRLTPDHPELSIAYVLLAKALGTIDQDFCGPIMVQLANASGKGPLPDEETLNFLLSVINGITPRDQTEAMLAAQMAVVHCTFMTFARRLNRVDSIPQQDAAERAFNKLARTFAVQIEALKRYRTGGEQKMTVQHVHVNEGGQAIVGNVAPIPATGEGTQNLAPSP